MRKTAFCICENKGADQLHSNCTADQPLCFCYMNSTNHCWFYHDVAHNAVLSNSETSVGFLMIRHIMQSYQQLACTCCMLTISCAVHFAFTRVFRGFMFSV